MTYLARIAFSPADYMLAQQIIDSVAAGTTLTRTCRLLQFPVARFLSIVKSNPELAEAYEVALQIGYDILAEKLVDADTELSSDPAVANVLSKNIQWFLTKRDKKRYGEHSVQEIHVTADKTITDALAAARQRAVDASAALTYIDTTAIDVTPKSATLSPDEEVELARLLNG